MTTLKNKVLSVDSNTKITTTEMHTAGEPLRIVEAGFPDIEGKTILDKREYVKEYLDDYRKFLMYEPRGHYDMYGAVLVKPDIPSAHIAVLFMHNEGLSTMCGHAVIALGRYAVDNGYVKTKTSPETEVNIQCPCGLVKTFVSYNNGLSGCVRFHSVPAFIHSKDIQIDVPKFGRIILDVSYGGAFYAILLASRLGLDLSKSKLQELIAAASSVTEAVKQQVKIIHPESAALGFLYGTILTDDVSTGTDGKLRTSNICVFANEEVDRSPTGSGVTARIALMLGKGQIKMNEKVTFISSTTQGEFTGSPIERVNAGDQAAVCVEVAGQAFYTGKNSFIYEKEDTLGKGFLLH
ncbi:trans-L-3-hydroxyproline dehydratase-like [Argonauta hians]